MNTKENNTKENNITKNNGKASAAIANTDKEKPKRLSKAGRFMRKYGNRGEIVDMRAVLK